MLAAKCGQLAALTVWIAPSGLTQSFDFGLKGGVPLTPYFATGRSTNPSGSSEYSAATRRYTLGVSTEWRLTQTIGFELDALYKRMGYVGILAMSSGSVVTTSAFDVKKGHSWEFPLLAKYRFGKAARPYVAGGAVLRYIGPVRARGEVTMEDLRTGTVTRTPIDTTEPSELRKRVYPGVIVASGFEFGTGRLRLLPEFRYTRWTANIAGPGGPLRFEPNQAEFFFGLLF